MSQGRIVPGRERAHIPVHQAARVLPHVNYEVTLFSLTMGLMCRVSKSMVDCSRQAGFNNHVDSAANFIARFEELVYKVLLLRLAFCLATCGKPCFQAVLFKTSQKDARTEKLVWKASLCN